MGVFYYYSGFLLVLIELIILSIIKGNINIYILAGKPARYRRVVVDLKASRYIGERDIIINPIMGNLTIITKG